MSDQSNQKPVIERLIKTFGEKEVVKDFDEEEDLYRPADQKEVAQRTLFLIGKPAVLPLIEALASENIEVRHWVVSTLGDLEDERIIEPLLKLLENKDEDLYLCWSILRILGSLKDNRAVEPLIRIFVNQDYQKIRGQIAVTLGKLGDRQAVVPLMEALSQDQDNAVRRWSAHALGDIGDPRALELLSTLLNDQDAEIRSTAISSLSQLSGVNSYDLIVPFLTDPDFRVRDVTVTALGVLGDKRACPLLVELLESKPVNQAAILQALCKLGSDCAYPLLLKLFHGGSNYLAGMAASYLGEFRFPNAFELLITKIRNGDDYLEPYAAMALGKLGNERAFEPLVRVLREAPERISIYAAIGLGLSGDKRAYEPLVEALDYGSPDMRFRVIKALGWIKDPRSLPVLEYRALHDFERAEDAEEESAFICDAAIEAIKEIRREERSAK
ncbi:MAG TPA: HEAT repeat domain-containing protein [Chloroflexia bacterium]|nr:HEAT repeat domain-containing protein [Chloroflexia bacterium]